MTEFLLGMVTGFMAGFMAGIWIYGSTVEKYYQAVCECKTNKEKQNATTKN